MGEPQSLRDVVAALQAGPAGAPTHQLTPYVGDPDVLNELLTGVNGTCGGSTVSMKISYVEVANYALVPETFVSAEAATPVECFRLTEEVRTKIFLKSHTAYTPQAHDVDIRKYLLLQPIAIIMLAALNMANLADPIEAFVVATGLGLGLYNLGDGIISREWKTTATVPEEKFIIAATEKFGGKKFVPWLQFAYDVISYLGYCRINFTHPVNSKDPSRTATQSNFLTNLLHRIWPNEKPINDGMVDKLLHGRVHGMSLHGAVGWHLFWTGDVACSAYLVCRADLVGDVYKSAAISYAGYLILMSNPIVALVLEALVEVAEHVRKDIARTAKVPWRRSSLSTLFCKEGPSDLGRDTVTFIMRMTPLIVAAVEEDLLPRSFATAYHITKSKDKLKAGVSFWVDIIKHMKTRTKSFSLKDIRTLFLQGDNLIEDEKEEKPKEAEKAAIEDAK